MNLYYYYDIILEILIERFRIKWSLKSMTSFIMHLLSHLVNCNGQPYNYLRH